MPRIAIVSFDRADSRYRTGSGLWSSIVIKVSVAWHIDVMDDLIGTRVISSLIGGERAPTATCLCLSQSLVASLVNVSASCSRAEESRVYLRPRGRTFQTKS